MFAAINIYINFHIADLQQYSLFARKEILQELIQMESLRLRF